MSTAQDYLDSFDKEALVMNAMARIGSNAIARSGQKLGRIPDNFGAAVPKIKPAAGVKAEPFTAKLKSDTSKPKNWVTNPIKNFKQAGAPNNPLGQQQTVRPGSGQIRI